MIATLASDLPERVSKTTNLPGSQPINRRSCPGSAPHGHVALGLFHQPSLRQSHFLAVQNGNVVRCRHVHVNTVARQFKLLRSEEHTSELQSLRHLVCRLLLE